MVDRTELFALHAFAKIAHKEACETLGIVDGVLTCLGGAVDIVPEGLCARSHEYPAVA